MLSTKQVWSLAGVLILLLGLAGCMDTPTQTRVSEAQTTIPIPDKTNYYERRQIAEAEAFNDQPAKLVFWYILSDDGRLITSFTCKGRPVSSTESMEPNQIYGAGSTQYGQYGFAVPLEGGITAYSPDAMGTDGTYGDPVPFRFCMTPDGHYVDVPATQRYIVSSIPLTFPYPEVRFNEELESKKLQAETAVKAGRCVDSALNVIDCAQVQRNEDVPTPPAGTTP